MKLLRTHHAGVETGTPPPRLTPIADHVAFHCPIPEPEIDQGTVRVRRLVTVL